MGILSFTTVLAGQSGNFIGGNVPRRVSIVTTDNLATVTTAGYLNNIVRESGNTIYPTDIIDMWYGYSSNSSPGTYDVFLASISSGSITLSLDTSAGNVLLPVVSGDFAVYNGITGQIKDSGFSPSDPLKTKVVMANGATVVNHIMVSTDLLGTSGNLTGTALNDGSIQAGRSGIAGNLISYPAGALAGRLILSAIGNSGDFTVTISNAIFGQASTLSIQDVGAASANFIMSSLAGAGIQHITNGSLSVDTGNLLAGSSGNAGSVRSFPPTALNGELILAAVNAGGAFNTTISNAASVGQSQVISIPDSGAVGANFLISSTLAGTQTLSGALSLVGGSNNIQLTGGGNFIAGASGAAGFFVSYPPTALNGRLILEAINSGNFDVTINNVVMGQATVYSIPDPANAVGRFLVSAGAAPFTAGNFPVASGTGGLMVDSGLPAANIQNKTNIVANVTADIGGAGAGPISVVVAGLTAASIITASVKSASNAVGILKIIATGTGFDVTFTGDPGASAFVNYVAFIVAQ